MRTLAASVPFGENQQLRNGRVWFCSLRHTQRVKPNGASPSCTTQQEGLGGGTHNKQLWETSAATGYYSALK